jgi:hypothetical protein
MNEITEERLIELAEGSGSLTADEKRLLETQPALQAQLEEWRLLFSDLKKLPTPEPDEIAVGNILPAVRRGIEKRKDRSFVGAITQPGFVPRLTALAASLVLIIGLGFLLSGIISPQPGAVEIDSSFAMLFSGEPFVLAESLHIEASMVSELELFADLEEDVADESFDLIDGDSTFILMQAASELDEESFLLLAATLEEEEM